MCRRVAGSLALLAGALAGCFTGQPERSLSRLGPAPFGGPAGADVVQIDVAIVERPLGDRYLNGDLWQLADEQGVTLERKPVLEENGFRVGLVGGLLPAGLQGLLTAPRSCPDPHRLSVRAGNAAAVTLGSVWGPCRFEVRHGAEAAAVELADAQCVLEVVPTLTDDGRTLLHFTPHVRHGQPRMVPRATQDPSGWRRWECSASQPEEAYAVLSWELTVAPNEYVVVGTLLGKPDTLGQRCFAGGEGAEGVQRLLVLRTGRSPPSAAPADEEFARSPPIALRAAWGTARGQAP
ncbi:MAG TPA: hypothetical protein VFE78_19610 [Gemmataceae bacterium]|nr:hypothetical protein [Gemmataceae bacterium]